ncbi:MAG: hypothetical protein HGA38_00035 [Candidatus Moranbacteria bacterium]|nr:hypothetical protein [Candidatus Moranbacteria bacterium]
MTLPFSNRHKNGLRSFFAVSFFLLSALFVLHVGIDGSVFHPGDGSFFVTAQAADGDAEVSVADKIGAWFADAVIGNAVKPFLWLINFALWIVLKFETLILIFATTIFGWAVDPTSVRNTLNMASVYTLWRMVRDFFNLFFILTILFIAFATIFQVHAYNYKKLLWHLVLMALLVNFSFPVTRFIIDATNVPMYFFMESMFRDNSSPNPTQLFGTVFSTSGLQQIMVPDFQDFYATFSDPSTMTTRLIISIIFMFLFSMSLLVMAVLFVIRLIMLTVLIIFAPLGFAGTAIPGFEGYAKQWWNHLFKYAIFGPSAMLMMLVAVTFLQNFKNDQLGSGTFSNYSSNLTSTNDDKTLIASMAQTIVPIVLIWMAISTGQTAGIQGAAGITSWAQKTSKMAGKNAAKWSGYGAGASLRWATTTKNKDGNVQARSLLAKNKTISNFTESRGRRSYAKASLREKEREQWGFRKNRRELLGRMSEADLLKELHNTQGGVQGIAGKLPGALGKSAGKMYGANADVAQAIVKSGFHKKLDPDRDNEAGIRDSEGNLVKNREVLQMIHKTLESVGDKDSLKSLESERADVMLEAIRRKGKEDSLSGDEIKKKVKTKVEQWVADGEHKKASNVNVMNEEFVNAMVDSLGINSAMSKIAEMPSNVTRKAEQVAEKALLDLRNRPEEKGGSTESWKDTERWRMLGASVSSDAHKYFSTFDADEKLTGKLEGELAAEAEKYANSMRSARIDKLSKEAAVAFASVAGVEYLSSAADSKIEGSVRRNIYDTVKKSDDELIKKHLLNNPKWSSYGEEGGASKKSVIVDKHGRPYES